MAMQHVVESDWCYIDVEFHDRVVYLFYIYSIIFYFIFIFFRTIFGLIYVILVNRNVKNNKYMWICTHDESLWFYYEFFIMQAVTSKFALSNFFRKLMHVAIDAIGTFTRLETVP